MAVINLTPATNRLQSGRSVAQVPVQGVPGAIEAAGAMGAGIARTADAVGQLVERQQQLDDNLTLMRARTGFLDRLGQIEIEAGQGTDYGTAPERFRASATEEARRQAEQLPARIRDRFSLEAESLVAPRVVSVRREAFQQQSQATVATTQESLRQLGHQAAGARNDAERASLVASAETTIRGLVDTGAINEAGAARLRQGFRSDVAKAEIGALIARSPGEALRAINGGRWNDAMDADSIQAYRDRADAAIARNEARAEAAANRAERRVAVELNQVNGLFAAGIVPTERVERLQAMARGTIYESQIPGMVQTAREVGRFAAMSAPQQAETMAAYEARARAPNATDADMTAYQRFAQIRQQQQSDLNQRGLARAVQDGVVQPLPAFDPANPEVVRQYEGAAQAATAHYGRPVSMLTDAGARDLNQRFLQAQPEQALQMLLGLTEGLQDPAVRGATLQHLERLRGDAGRMAPGTLTRLASLARSGFDGQQQALRLLSSLRADVSDRARLEGEAPAFRAAVNNVVATGPQRVATRQAEITGVPAYAAVVSRDLDIIRRDAMVRMTAGESSPERAVQAAAAALNADRQVIDDSSLGAVYFPRSVPAQEVRSGLETLRTQAATTPAPAAGQSSQDAVAARARQEAARRAQWVNEGSRFALVIQGQAGVPVVLREATLEEVLGAGRGVIRERAATPPPVRQENTIQQRERARREAERGALTAPPVVQ